MRSNQDVALDIVNEVVSADESSINGQRRIAIVMSQHFMDCTSSLQAVANVKEVASIIRKARKSMGLKGTSTSVVVSMVVKSLEVFGYRVASGWSNNDFTNKIQDMAKKARRYVLKNGVWVEKPEASELEKLIKHVRNVMSKLSADDRELFMASLNVNEETSETEAPFVEL